MECKIGEIFEFSGEWYQCLKGTSCKECDFSTNNVTCDIYGEITCTRKGRNDDTSVIFKKLEKVGEPYEHYEKFYQCYKLPMETEIRLLPNNCYPIGKDNLVEIEIKQNQENMEENKLNLKPFDLEAAKLGKPVCTRDGRKARIICFDTKGDPCPIIALVEENNIESAYHYDKNGQNAYKKSEIDLMMLPEKKEGWVNVYNADTTFYFVEGMVYDTKEEAIKHINPDNEIYITTVKVQWEE